MGGRLAEEASAGALSKRDGLHFDESPVSLLLETSKEVIIGVTAERSISSSVDDSKYASLSRGKMMCSEGL